MAQTVHHSTCALDCPDACAVLVSVEDGRVTRFRGDPAHPVTRGFLCGKVAQYAERVNSPHRLLYPQRRTGAKGEGRFERITWDEAIATIAGRFEDAAARYGSESILPYSYAGTMGYLQGSGMDRRFFHRLGASRLDRTICSGAGVAALNQTLGARTGTEPEQFRHSKLIIAWGANILGTSVHLWPFIVEARRNGARFYTIDPVKNRTGSLSDRHFFINPGSDQALVLAMMHVILGEGLEDRAYIDQYTTGITALREHVRAWTPERAEALTGILRDDIVALAREYATTRPVAIRLNYGVQRTERGGSATCAIAMLPALTGSWKDIGGGLLVSTSGGYHINRAALERPDLQQISLGRDARIVNMSTLGSALTGLSDPPVKAMMVYNSNPAAVVPDQHRVHRGLAREDLFLVVAEQFQTDTADYADILLPSTMFAEHDDLYFAYGHYYMQLARKAAEPPGECKPNSEVFRLLAARMGFTDPCFADSDDDMIRQSLASPHPYLQGVTLERLEREHSVRLNVSPEGEPFQPHAQGFPGTGGRMEFRLDALAYEPPDESRHGTSYNAAFPLEFISPKNDDSMNSTFGNRPTVDAQTAALVMHTLDAGSRGIQDGDPVRVFNGRGNLLLKASVNGAVRPGVVSSPSVRWPKMTPNRQGPNALTSERLADMGGSPAFYNCMVQVERCGD